MAKTRTYSHFCPVARSLETIGEKWSLLIVRDLLRGPQRFTDLFHYLGGITPKWLTARLRDLEFAGIIEREHESGRREVWYRLTPKGAALAPVVEALAVWGVDHALRPPRPGEPVHPERAMVVMATYRNTRHTALAAPATWVFDFGGDRAYTLRYDGDRWSYSRGDTSEADVRIETTPEAWVGVLTAPAAARRTLLEALDISGDQAAVAAFLAGYEVSNDSAAIRYGEVALRTGLSVRHAPSRTLSR